MPKSRILVVGDIHGGLKALIQVIDRASITTLDKLIFLGDYVDGWSQSPQVLDYLIGLSQTHNCIFMQGNHDNLLLQWLESSKYNTEWYDYGGLATVNAYKMQTYETKLRHIDFLKSLHNYYIDDKNRLFLHAGFTNQRGVKAEFFLPMFYWDRTLWETALALNPMLTSSDSCYPKRFKHYFEIYIGHTPTTYIGEKTPQNRANIWNMDTGAGFLGRLSIMDIETKEFWQSDELKNLYNDEVGRN